jgi:hypothetical protein
MLFWPIWKCIKYFSHTAWQYTYPWSEPILCATTLLPKIRDNFYVFRSFLFSPDYENKGVGSTICLWTALNYDLKQCCKTNNLPHWLSGIIWFSGGGTGFVGTAFSKLLRSKGYGVNIVSRMPGPQRISWVTITNKSLELICIQYIRKMCLILKVVGKIWFGPCWSSIPTMHESQIRSTSFWYMVHHLKPMTHVFNKT